ncbi:hypothetical protein EX30DRAFT_373505 [Ascodesmis nigricans]|uniref:Uncharacterized protein n=1 Tax=Ascodesmis nigricans TaxID=341454 RepID=A0A4V3SI55_9PEZI|nr:hypothetical protein EX30DRAFT_373505 [Ascodesmis nigricans]
MPLTFDLTCFYCQNSLSEASPYLDPAFPDHPNFTEETAYICTRPHCLASFIIDNAGYSFTVIYNNRETEHVLVDLNLEDIPTVLIGYHDASEMARLERGMELMPISPTDEQLDLLLPPASGPETIIMLQCQVTHRRDPDDPGMLPMRSILQVPGSLYTPPIEGVGHDDTDDGNFVSAPTSTPVLHLEDIQDPDEIVQTRTEAEAEPAGLFDAENAPDYHERSILDGTTDDSDDNSGPPNIGLIFDAMDEFRHLRHTSSYTIPGAEDPCRRQVAVALQFMNLEQLYLRRYHHHQRRTESNALWNRYRTQRPTCRLCETVNTDGLQFTSESALAREHERRMLARRLERESRPENPEPMDLDLDSLLFNLRNIVLTAQVTASRSESAPNPNIGIVNTGRVTPPTDSEEVHRETEARMLGPRTRRRRRRRERMRETSGERVRVTVSNRFFETMCLGCLQPLTGGEAGVEEGGSVMVLGGKRWCRRCVIEGRV